MNEKELSKKEEEIYRNIDQLELEQDTIWNNALNLFLTTIDPDLIYECMTEESRKIYDELEELIEKEYEKLRVLRRKKDE